MKKVIEDKTLAIPKNNSTLAQNFSVKQAFHLLKGYFVDSDEKWIAWLLLVGIIISILAFVGAMLALSWWTAGFWAAIASHSWLPVLISLGQFAGLLVGIISANTLKNYQIGVLTILWRDWLTTQFKQRLFKNKNYLKLTRTVAEIDNIAQRIQDDIASVIKTSLTLAADFFRSLLSLGSFAGVLWLVGGALSIGLNIVIPGYLVWVAVFVAIVATAITYFIGKSLAKTSVELKSSEANLRQDLAILNDDAENIATASAEDYYFHNITQDLIKVCDLANEKLSTETKVSAFQDFYMQISSILPILASIPLYFSGVIQLTDIMQISFAFMEVSSSLSWFANNYQQTSKYKSSLGRLIELNNSFDKVESSSPYMAIQVEDNIELVNIEIKKLSIRQPNKPEDYIFCDLNLTLRKGEHTLIQGDSGIGKSTLLKVLSKNWQCGEGAVSLPPEKMCFLPQFVSIPKDSLKAILAYPQPESTYTDDEYTAALIAVGKMKEFLPLIKSNQPDIQLQKLSGGQKQRIAFARVLLQKPVWVILDEATASLGTKSQCHLYETVKRCLPKTTIVSIGQRDELKALHSRCVFFKANKGKSITVKEKNKPLIVSLG